LKTEEPTQSCGILLLKIGTVLEGLALAEDSRERIPGWLRSDTEGLTAGKTDINGHT
jgi:hypothetical protein